ncbi:MAG: T9SS type A sorting domain-containing protein [Bacteroidetes bacterium]|nr:T9SS type A sorting domain-containing protein [Bacteroidota bacterium]
MKLLPFFIFCFLTQTGWSQTRVVDIFPQSAADFVTLNRLGLTGDHPVKVRIDGNSGLRLYLDPLETSRLKTSGVPHRIISENWEAEYHLALKKNQPFLAKALDSSRVTSFKFGSMGGYLTLAEVTSLLDSMARAHPDLLTKGFTAGKSYENRDILVWKLSDHPETDENEPEILFTALHHAREPQGMTSALYFLLYLVENYDKNPGIRQLVDSREIYFIPVVNPDGYVYNETSQPGGGGMWRKNRRLNEDFTYGIDLNRNYGVGWGYDDEGSSPDPSTNVYRGTSAFSEPETQVIRDFCNTRNFYLALNYHSYGNLLIYPWGYKRSHLTPDSVRFDLMSQVMTRANGFLAGTSDQTVGYLTNGDSDDWMYGEKNSKPPVFALTPEVGTNEDGFWPLPNRIIPLAEACMEMNFYALKLPDGFPYVELSVLKESSGDGYFSAGEEASAIFKIRNIGGGSLRALQGIPVLKSGTLTQNIQAAQLPELDPDSSETVVIPFTIPESAHSGDSLSVSLVFSLNGETLRMNSPVELTGIPRVYFSDSFDQTLGYWSVSAGWKQTSQNPFSAPYAIHESPAGLYPNNANRSVTLKNPVSLPVDKSGLELQFRTRFEIEADWDFGQVLASPDKIIWTPLSGKLTSPGSGFDPQVAGEPYYDGFQRDWVKESVDLSEWPDTLIWLRFLFVSDNYTQFDGWYLDDARIVSFLQGEPVSVDETEIPKKAELVSVYPNPFNPETRVILNLPQDRQINWELYNLEGRRVRSREGIAGRQGKTELPILADGLSSGLYFLKIQAGNDLFSARLLLIR